MNKKRILHAVMMALSVAGAVCVALEKLPRWAAAASVALALVTNLEKVIGAIDATAGLTVVFMGLLLGHALFGCATLSTVAKVCAPSTADETQAITDLFERLDLTTAEVIAAAEGGKIAVCVVTEVAKDILNRASQIKAATAAGETPIVARAQAWVQKHP